MIIIMLVIVALCWWFFQFNRSPTSWIRHQHLKLVTNTFGLQHPSPTSMSPIFFKCFYSVSMKKKSSLMENQKITGWKMISMKNIHLIFRMSNSSRKKAFFIFLASCSLPKSILFGMRHQIKQNVFCPWENKPENQRVPNMKVFKTFPGP